MGKGRLEAFSDGVLAIIITIMVLELKIPDDGGLDGLRELAPHIGAYLMSFVYLGIYWNNHHHMLQAVREVNGRVLWANMHLLFWLSLIPFGTAWLGHSHDAPWPAVIYGVILECAAMAYYILARALVSHHGVDSTLAVALGADRKGKASIGLYLVGIALAFAHPLAAVAVYTAVAALWLVPDRRIERLLVTGRDPGGANKP
jgi:uncharacterized membrane protein